MKTLLFLFAAAFYCSAATAQRCLPGMRGVELHAGWVDGFDASANRYLGVALSTYTPRGDRWALGVEWLDKHYAYRDFSIPKAQYTAEGGYLFKLLADPSKALFVSIGSSVLLGYETSNRGQKLLPDGATLLDADALVYGGAVGLELEAYLADRIAVLVRLRERILWGSSIGRFHTQFGVGLKFIVN